MNSMKNEIKCVLKIAKWEYFLKIFTSVVIRAVLLVIPILFSEFINCVTNNEFESAIIYIVVLIFAASIYRFF